MQYMILIYGCQSDYASVSEAEMGKVYEEYMHYSKALVDAKAFISGASLKEIATATTVRVKNGKTVTTDGPFAETKEQLGGYYIVEAATLDEAVKYAAMCPGSKHGSCEVRPLGVITAADGGIAAMQ